jgi:hypothetical protein
MRDYSQDGDPYGVSEYTAQSADQDVAETLWRKSGGDRDVRGCSLVQPRSVPTQAEADAIKGAINEG